MQSRSGAKVQRCSGAEGEGGRVRTKLTAELAKGCKRGFNAWELPHALYTLQREAAPLLGLEGLEWVDTGAEAAGHALRLALCGLLGQHEEHQRAVRRSGNEEARD